MKMFVRSDLVHAIFEEEFGGIANFVEEWGGSAEQGGRGLSTLYKWLSDGLPGRSESVFAFFGALGIDPIAVIDLERSKLARNFGRLRMAFMLGGANAGGFAPLFELFRPGAGWPQSDLLIRHFGRPCATFDFLHDAELERNTYATITANAKDGHPANRPRAFHIAYRRRPSPDGLWRPYGTVVTRAGEAVLVHENGDIQCAAQPSRSAHQIRFKTYFGPSPVEFRIASLGAFTCKVEPYDDPVVTLHFRA